MLIMHMIYHIEINHNHNHNHIPPKYVYKLGLHAKGQLRSTQNEKMAAILIFAPSEDDISERFLKKLYLFF